MRRIIQCLTAPRGAALETHIHSEPSHILVVTDADQYRRLDQFVAAALAPERSRSQIARMIKAGLITVNGKPARASCVVRCGDRIEIASRDANLDEWVSQAGQADESLNIEVLFCDQELIAINKPAGIVVHPSAGHPDATVANIMSVRFPELAAMTEPDGLLRAGIVHRLDKQTSGVMVVARNSFARMALSRQFKERKVSKVYLAIALGIIRRESFTVNYPLGRHPVERKRMSIRSSTPRDAETEFRVLHRFTDKNHPTTLVWARPLTGRTHQIRVHLAASGHPCLGDTLYGGKTCPEWSREGQALHALALTITHPRSGEKLEFVAPLPGDMAHFIERRGLAFDSSTVRQWIGPQ
jgi:23S rRNA pseudouridine1911/1915/1917 synthase